MHATLGAAEEQISYVQRYGVESAAARPGRR
jgi:hypothetical protein